MTYAFLDESGDEIPFGGEPCLVVALLSVDQPRALELAVTRARRKYGASLASGEMKADAAPPEVTTWLLHAIAAAPIEIVAVILDKAAILRPPADPRAIYRFVVAEAVRRAAQHQPQLDLCLDKRYTSLKLRQLLELAIRDNLAGLGAKVVIRHEDSIAEKGLQAVDFVAWALFQKYARDKREFYDIIAPRIVVEELLRIAMWD
jgi:LmbE family N-acetylglucosaminyl deacetylase